MLQEQQEQRTEEVRGIKVKKWVYGRRSRSIGECVSVKQSSVVKCDDG